jgi:hypothetical protein
MPIGWRPAEAVQAVALLQIQAACTGTRGIEEIDDIIAVPPDLSVPDSDPLIEFDGSLDRTHDTA